MVKNEEMRWHVGLVCKLDGADSSELGSSPSWADREHRTTNSATDMCSLSRMSRLAQNLEIWLGS